MLIRFIKWFHGYLLVRIQGYSPERFINLCSNHNIIIWNLTKVEDGFEFYITVKAFKTIRPIARKTHTRPLIRQKIGLPFHMARLKHHRGFALGFFIAIAITYTLSLFIWDIGVSGQYKHTEEAIIKFLKSQDVYAGVLKGDIHCQDIEDAIRKEYTDIGWVSAEIRGTRLLIKITETNMPKPYEVATNPCHIVAGKAGIVTSIVTRTGTPEVGIGDIVKKGDRLVSGFLNIMSDDGTILRQKPVIADADVKIKTFYEYSDQLDLKYMDKSYTGEEEHYYCLSIFGHSVYFLNPFKDYNKYEKSDEVVSESQLRLNENFYLPIKWGKTENYEYEEIERVYSNGEAQELLTQHLERYLKLLQDNHVEIIENSVKFEFDKERAYAKGMIIVEEPVYETIPVDQSELVTEPPATTEPNT